jgi:hypothetical protein
MFGWGRKAEIDRRSKQIERMVGLIREGLRRKSYEQFVKDFSNPGETPDAVDRSRGQTYFTMKISPTCWYEVTAMYPRRADNNPPFLDVHGGGDDFGVFITASAASDRFVEVDLHLAFEQKEGRDARPMVTELLHIPGWQQSGATTP